MTPTFWQRDPGDTWPRYVQGAYRDPRPREEFFALLADMAAWWTLNRPLRLSDLRDPYQSALNEHALRLRLAISGTR